MPEELRQNKVFGLFQKSITQSQHNSSNPESIQKNNSGRVLQNSSEEAQSQGKISSSVEESCNRSLKSFGTQNKLNYSPFLNDAIQGMPFTSQNKQKNELQQQININQGNVNNLFSRNSEQCSNIDISFLGNPKQISQTSDQNSFKKKSSGDSLKSPYFKDESLLSQIQSSRKQKAKIQQDKQIQELKNSSSSQEIFNSQSSNLQQEVSILQNVQDQFQNLDLLNQNQKNQFSRQDYNPNLQQQLYLNQYEQQLQQQLLQYNNEQQQQKLFQNILQNSLQPFSFQNQDFSKINLVHNFPQNQNDLLNYNQILTDQMFSKQQINSFEPQSFLDSNFQASDSQNKFTKSKINFGGVIQEEQSDENSSLDNFNSIQKNYKDEIIAKQGSQQVHIFSELEEEKKVQNNLNEDALKLDINLQRNEKKSKPRKVQSSKSLSKQFELNSVLKDKNESINSVEPMLSSIDMFSNSISFQQQTFGNKPIVKVRFNSGNDNINSQSSGYFGNKSNSQLNNNLQQQIDPQSQQSFGKKDDTNWKLNESLESPQRQDGQGSNVVSLSQVVGRGDNQMSLGALNRVVVPFSQQQSFISLPQVDPNYFFFQDTSQISQKNQKQEPIPENQQTNLNPFNSQQQPQVDYKFYNPFQSTPLHQVQDIEQILQNKSEPEKDKSSGCYGSISDRSKMSGALQVNQHSSQSFSPKSNLQSQDKKDNSKTSSSAEIKSQISESLLFQIFAEKIEQLKNCSPQVICDFSLIRIQNQEVVINDQIIPISKLKENLIYFMNDFQNIDRFNEQLSQNLSNLKFNNSFQKSPSKGQFSSKEQFLHKVKFFLPNNDNDENQKMAVQSNQSQISPNLYPIIEENERIDQQIVKSNIQIIQKIDSDSSYQNEGSGPPIKINRSKSNQYSPDIEEYKKSYQSFISIDHMESKSSNSEEINQFISPKLQQKQNLLELIDQKLERVQNRLSFADAIEVAVEKFKIEDEEIEQAILNQTSNLIKNSQGFKELQQQLELLMKENNENQLVCLKKNQKKQKILQSELESINERSNEQSLSSSLSVGLKNFIMKFSASVPVKIGGDYSRLLNEIYDSKNLKIQQSKDAQNNQQILEKRRSNQIERRYLSSNQLITTQLIDKIEILEKVENKSWSNQQTKQDDDQEIEKRKQTIEKFKQQILSKRPSKIGSMLRKRNGEMLLLSNSPASYFNVQGQVKIQTKKLCNRKQFGPQGVSRKEQEMIQAFESKVEKINEVQKNNIMHLNSRMFQILKGNWKQNDIILETEQDLLSPTNSRDPSGFSFGSLASLINSYNLKLYAKSMSGIQLSNSFFSSPYNFSSIKNSKNLFLNQSNSGNQNYDAISQNSVFDKGSPNVVNYIEAYNDQNSQINSPQTQQQQASPLEKGGRGQSFDIQKSQKNDNHQSILNIDSEKKKKKKRSSSLLSSMNTPIIVINDNQNSQIIDLNQILRNVNMKQFKQNNQLYSNDKNNRMLKKQSSKSFNREDVNNKKVILVNKNGDIMEVKQISNADIFQIEQDKNQQKLVSGSSLSKYLSAICSESYTKLLLHSHGSHSLQTPNESGELNPLLIQINQSKESKLEKRVSISSNKGVIQQQNNEIQENKDIIQDHEQDQIRRQQYIDQLNLEQINEQSHEDKQKSFSGNSFSNLQPFLQNKQDDQSQQIKPKRLSQQSFVKFQVTNSDKQKEISKLSELNSNNQVSIVQKHSKLSRSQQSPHEPSSLVLERCIQKQNSKQRVKALYRIQNQPKSNTYFDLISGFDSQQKSVNKKVSFQELGQITENMQKSKDNDFLSCISQSNQKKNKKSSDSSSKKSHNIIQRGRAPQIKKRQFRSSDEISIKIETQQSSTNKKTKEQSIKGNILVDSIDNEELSYDSSVSGNSSEPKENI